MRLIRAQPSIAEAEYVFTFTPRHHWPDFAPDDLFRPLRDSPMRRRIIKPNTRSYTGRHVGMEAGTVVRFESALERDFLTLVRFRQDLVELEEQPKTYAYPDSAGRMRKYTPDFRVRLNDRTIYYEVKYREQLRQQWPLFKQIVPFMRRHLRFEEGAFYRVVTEQTIRGVRFENIRLLAPHTARVPDAALAGALLDRLRQIERTSIADLLNGIDKGDRAAFYATLWSLMAQRKVGVDLNTPICMQCTIWSRHE